MSPPVGELGEYQIAARVDESTIEIFVNGPNLLFTDVLFQYRLYIERVLAIVAAAQRAHEAFCHESQKRLKGCS